MHLGILLFESNDADSWDRAMQPIYVRDHVKDGKYKMNNRLNAYMDHVWDGFYTGQVRMSRFPALVQGDKGVYDLEFTGTPAKKMKFLFKSLFPNTGLTIRIAYPGAESRGLVKDGKVVVSNKWDDKLRGYGPIL